jgi:hypothetical protein
MDAILSVLTVIFIAISLVVAFTLGFALLIWFAIFALIVTGFIFLRQFWWRWRFTSSNKSSTQQSKIIEVDYEEVNYSDKYQDK